MIGKHTIMTWSTTQGVTALSSGEAELYAMVKGSAITLGLISLAHDFGLVLHGKVHSDASAAIGMVNRTGVGRLRHVRVQFLWVQDAVREGDLKVSKVKGEENPSDLLTKHVSAELIRRHCSTMGYEQLTSRAESAPKLASLGPEGNDSSKDLGHSDDWSEHQGDFGNEIVRVHRRPRRCLFTPLRVRGSPPAKHLTPVRITTGKFADGQEFQRIDTWTARPTAHFMMPSPWTGETRFIFRTERC